MTMSIDTAIGQNTVPRGGWEMAEISHICGLSAIGEAAEQASTRTELCALGSGGFATDQGRIIDEKHIQTRLEILRLVASEISIIDGYGDFVIACETLYQWVVERRLP